MSDCCFFLNLLLMRNRIIFLFLFSFAFQSVKSQAGEQKPSNFFMCHLGGGTSSLQGWSAFGSFSYERNNNEFTIRGVYNSQVGHRKRDFIGYDYYNDHFGDAAILYGRTFRKNFFFTSFSLGAGYYGYTDQYLFYRPDNNWLTNSYDVGAKHYSGLGLACESKVALLGEENVGMCLLFWCNINADKSVYGASIAMTFGKIRN